MRLTMSSAGVPAAYAGALLPIPTTTPRASSGGLVRVHGQPGTQGIPAPKPAAIPETAAGWRGNQSSYAAPDVLFPSIYYTTPENMHPPVSLARDTPMPVPAISYRHLASVTQRMRRVGGQTQIMQPAVIQQWPQWRGAGS